MNLAPIVLFVYNRLWHTKKTIEALQRNDLAKESLLFIFSDGAKSKEDEKKVREVRKYIKTLSGFKEIAIVERERNYGLAQNIIDGITKVVNEYKKVIVLEDDIVVSPYFLNFMNEALEKYKDNKRVMSVSGYMFPIRTEGLPDTFFLKLVPGWGWGTWARAWKLFERNPEKQIKMLNKKQVKDFNLNGSYDFWQQLVLNYKGKLYTWAIFWYFTIYINNGLTLFPRESLVQNIGYDGSGTHCSKTDKFMTSLSAKRQMELPEITEEYKLARERLIEFFNKIKPPLYIRILSKIVPNSLKKL